MKIFVLRAFVLNALRRASYRYPARSEAMRRAKIERGKYLCAMCKVVHQRRNIQVDHIAPVINPATGFVDYNTYIERLFVPVESLQILCKKCHSEKSKAENAVRKKK